MPIESLVAAGAQGLSNLMSQAANTASTIFGNRAQRKWTERQYDKQRQDALSDFYLQNEYNSPAANMKRLKEAGLNPNLVYGNGNAIANAAPIRSAETGSYRPQSPTFDFGTIGGSALAAYYDTQTKQATIDNMAAQKAVADQQALHIAAQTNKTVQETEGSKFDLSQRQRLADTSAEIQAASLRKLNADTAYTLDNNERAAAMTAANLTESAERVLNHRMGRAVSREQIMHIRAQIADLKKTGVLKDLDIELQKQGIQKNDPIYMRLLGRLLGAKDPIEEKGKSGAMKHMFPLLGIFD